LCSAALLSLSTLIHKNPILQYLLSLSVARTGAALRVTPYILYPHMHYCTRLYDIDTSTIDPEVKKVQLTVEEATKAQSGSRGIAVFFL
jgi:hypothetical protein